MAGWERLSHHPLVDRAQDAQFWDEFLAQNPDVLHRLLADIYRATYGVDKPPSMEALWALMDVPEFSTETFGDAVMGLLERRKRSLSWLALQSGVTKQVLHRYVRGDRPVVNVYDPEGAMRRVESVAAPLRVHPSYFAEWRRLWVMTLIDSAFIAHPSLSGEVFRRFSGFALKSGNGRSDVDQRAAQ